MAQLKSNEAAPQEAATKEIIPLYGGDVEIHYWPKMHWYKDKEGSFLVSASRIAGLPDKGDTLKYWACNEMAGEVLYRHFGERYNIKELGSPERKDDPFLKQRVEVSVNDILQARLAWRNKSDEAKDIGTTVHDYAEAYGMAMMRGESVPKIPEGIPQQALNGINAFLAWVIDNNVEFVECEITVYSQKHNYVGRTDVIVRINDKLLLLDYKTANGLYDEHKDQVCGYMNAKNEEIEYVSKKHKTKIDPISGVALIQFNKDNGDFHYLVLPPEEIRLCTNRFLAFNVAVKAIKEHETFCKKYYPKTLKE